MWQYLTECTMWSVGGLLIGFFVGRTEREIWEIKKKVGANGDD
jgi:hypothetical protein